MKLKNGSNRGDRNILTSFAVVLILFLSSIAGATIVPVNSNSVIQDNIEYYMQTDKAVYTLGENVLMMYRVTNLRVEDVTFEFAYQQQCFFEVDNDETRIWGWPKRVSPALSSFTLQPGEFNEYLKDWDMINDNTGALVIPGNYEVTGTLMGSANDGTIPNSVTVLIQIVPEPTSLMLLSTGLIFVLKSNRRKVKF